MYKNFSDITKFFLECLKNSFDLQNKGIKGKKIKNKYHEIKFTYKIIYI